MRRVNSKDEDRIKIGEQEVLTADAKKDLIPTNGNSHSQQTPYQFTNIVNIQLKFYILKTTQNFVNIFLSVL
jgi:hypothetical protein